jgi:Xaa-Pro aminopeptidase
VDYRRRQDRIRERLGAGEALLVGHPANVRYLCGFTGSSGILAVTTRRSAFFTDGRYTQQAREQVHKAAVHISKASPKVAACRWLAEARTKAVAIESTRLTLADRRDLRKLLPSSIALHEASGWVEEVRQLKEPEELRAIRGAVMLGAALFETALAAIAAGGRECDVAAELEYRARRTGAEAMSFETIVAAGKRSALPHGRASRARLPRRGFVLLDFGVILAGYCSDMSRTVHVGRPSARAVRMYEAVRRAQQTALEAVRPGARAGDVDQAAREVLGKAGLGRYFTHSTGHGVGLEIHEPPRLGQGQNQELRPGMVITVEPGVYVPGVGGVRIEDMVVVTDHGRQVLTPVTKELITI